MLKQTLNKGISTPIAIGIIFGLAILLVGGILIYQTGLDSELITSIQLKLTRNPKKKCELAGDNWMESKNCCCPVLCLVSHFEEGKIPLECFCCFRDEEDETADWETYRDEKYGFEVKYPEDWQTELTLVGTIKIKNNISGSYFEIIEQAVNERSLSLDDWYKYFDEWYEDLTMVNGRPTAKAGAEIVFINGAKAYRIDTELEPPNPLFEIVGIASKERIFTLFAYSGHLNDNSVLEKMLSTFKFLD